MDKTIKFYCDHCGSQFSEHPEEDYCPICSMYYLKKIGGGYHKKYYCFQCDYEITPDDNGILINENSAHEIAQCDDCHYSEWGYHIGGGCLMF